MKGMRKLALGALAAAAAVILTSCGVPTSSSPKPLSPSVLPQVLTQPAPTLPPTKLHEIGAVEVPIYLLNPEDRLTSLVQYVHDPATPQEVLDALAKGPTTSQIDQGYQSALLPGSHLVIEGTPKNTAVVELDPFFFELTGQATALECGQIVDTLTTNFHRITRVKFRYAGASTAVEIGSGEVVFRAVDASDYRNLIS
ncbi:MAG: GerMN domain-containing protein [Acidimicrobiales bacterium]